MPANGNATHDRCDTQDTGRGTRCGPRVGGRRRVGAVSVVATADSDTRGGSGTGCRCQSGPVHEGCPRPAAAPVRSRDGWCLKIEPIIGYLRVTPATAPTDAIAFALWSLRCTLVRKRIHDFSRVTTHPEDPITDGPHRRPTTAWRYVRCVAGRVQLASSPSFNIPSSCAPVEVHLASESLPDHPLARRSHARGRARNRAAAQDVGRPKTGFHSRIPQPAHLDLVAAALAFFSGLLILS